MNSATEMLAADGRQVRHRAFDVWNIREDFPILKQQCMASHWSTWTMPPRARNRRW